MKFKTKIDWWLNVILIAIVALSMYLLVSAAINKSTAQLFSAVCFMLITAIIIAPLYFFTYYEISDDGILFVKSGYFYKKKIKISSIKAITPTNNPVSSAAMSARRIAIYYDTGKKDRLSIEYISPDKKTEFIEELIKINSDIIVKKA